MISCYQHFIVNNAPVISVCSHIANQLEPLEKGIVLARKTVIEAESAHYTGA